VVSMLWAVSMVKLVSCKELYDLCLRGGGMVPVYLGGALSGPVQAVALERVVEAGVAGLPVQIVITRLQLALVKALDALLATGNRDYAVRTVVDTVCEVFEDPEQCEMELGPLVEEIASTEDPDRINKLLEKAIEAVR